jgi:NADH-quinone oxidoreductase subunit C
MTQLTKNLQAQTEYIQAHFPNLQSVEVQGDNLIIYVGKERLIDFLHFLRDDKELSFKSLLDVFGADMLGLKEHRFEVIYNLLSLKLNNRITVKVALEEDEEVHTACGVFSAANWFERETFDMYGIRFTNHPDLRRILTDYGFEGHPLRKDFPLTGYKEVRYDEEKKKVVYEPVKLTQEYRNFDFEMPLEGTVYQIQQPKK